MEMSTLGAGGASWWVEPRPFNVYLLGTWVCASQLQPEMETAEEWPGRVKPRKRADPSIWPQQNPPTLRPEKQRMWFQDCSSEAATTEFEAHCIHTYQSPHPPLSPFWSSLAEPSEKTERPRMVVLVLPANS